MKSNGFFDDGITAEADVSKHESLCLQLRQLTTLTLCEELLERENAKIARELHNDLGQVLTALRLDISLFLLQHKAEAALAERANAMLVLTDRCMQTLCSLIDDLRRVPAFEHGLAAAIDALCRDSSQRHQFSYTLTDSADCSWLDDLQMIAIVRILQEALSNIVRHAAAGIVDVILTNTADAGLQIEICDNGCGFDLAEAQQGRHLGLMLMRENAFALGGQIDIVSENMIGTTVKLEIPMTLLKN